MSDRLSSEEQKFVGSVLTILFVVGAAIFIARSLFPYFLIGSIILFVVLIISIIVEVFFRDHDYLDFWNYVSTYVGIVFGIALIGMFITYFIGYGIGGTSLGEASLQVYTAFTGAEQQVSDALEQLINSVVEENCKILPQDQCDLLRATARNAKTLQEVTDLAEKLKKSLAVANSLAK